MNNMKLINGLLSKANKKEFSEFNEAFNKVSLIMPSYSIFINYLRIRYYDCYDMKKFISNVTSLDKKENNSIYLRKKKEYKDCISRLYGPFLSGRNNDDIKSLLKKSKEEIIIDIVNSSSLTNRKMKKIFKEANVTNEYDLYLSLYLQRKVKENVTKEKDLRTETDDEYIIWNYVNLRYEQHGKPLIKIFDCKDKWKELIKQYQNDEIENIDEPNSFSKITKSNLFSKKKYEIDNYSSRLKGALIGRFIGCMLGCPVENWSIEAMEEFAKNTNTSFPPLTYWNDVKDKENLHYKKDKKYYLSKDKMAFVVCDDDVTYTVLNTLVLEKYGKEFTCKQLADFWKERLPYACTAEYATMIGLRQNKSIKEIVNSNPFVELIGAAIRADVFGYVNKGDPYNAARLAYKDACITHKRNGIYGEMFLASAISLCFKFSPLESIKKAMNYIPKNSRLYNDLLWALSYEGKLVDYKQANYLLQKRFPYMNKVHTNNNMCAIVFSFILGENDFDKTISNCIAMGYDNDCTGASVGSMLGAYLTIDKIDPRWYKCFNDEVHTYIRGHEKISISKLLKIIENIK